MRKIEKTTISDIALLIIFLIIIAITVAVTAVIVKSSESIKKLKKYI